MQQRMHVSPMPLSWVGGLNGWGRSAAWRLQLHGCFITSGMRACKRGLDNNTAPVSFSNEAGY
jgi:hypothetical protein